MRKQIPLFIPLVLVSAFSLPVFSNGEPQVKLSRSAGEFTCRTIEDIDEEGIYLETLAAEVRSINARRMSTPLNATGLGQLIKRVSCYYDKTGDLSIFESLFQDENGAVYAQALQLLNPQIREEFINNMKLAHRPAGG